MDAKRFGIAVKGFIIKDGKILVIYKTATEVANDPDPEFKRDQPGGRLEFGEEPIKSLLREIKEEVGLIVDVIKPIDIWYYVKENFQLVGINYLCRWASGNIILSEEHEKYEWLSRDEIIQKNWEDKEQYLNAFDNMEIIKNE
jgi:8-oxo-dGTP diphosphatase